MNTPVYSKRYEIVITFLFFLTWGAIFLDRLTVSYASTALYKEFNLTDTQYSSLSTINALTFAFASIVGGMVSDRLGIYKNLLAPLTIISGITSLCCALFATEYYHIVLARGIVGLATGANMTLMFTILGNYNPKNLGRNSGIVNTGPPVIAYICGPLIMTRIVSSLTWNYCYALTGILLVLTGLAILFFVREIKTAPRDKKQATNKFLDMFRNKNYVLCIAFGICIMCVYWTVNLYSTTFMTKVIGIDAIKMGYIATSMGVFACVYGLLVPAASDRLGRKKILIIAGFLCCLAPLSMSAFSNHALALGPYILFGGISGALTPIWSSIIPMECLPPGHKATGSGVAYGITEIVSGSLWPIAAGTISDSKSISSVLIVGGFLALVGCSIGLFMKESKMQSDGGVT